jgi:hypothetical protein
MVCPREDMPRIIVVCKNMVCSNLSRKQTSYGLATYCHCKCQSNRKLNAVWIQLARLWHHWNQCFIVRCNVYEFNAKYCVIESLCLYHKMSARPGKHIDHTIAHSRLICVAVQPNAASSTISQWLSSSSKPSARNASLYAGYCCTFTLRISWNENGTVTLTNSPR